MLPVTSDKNLVAISTKLRARLPPSVFAAAGHITRSIRWHRLGPPSSLAWAGNFINELQFQLRQNLPGVDVGKMDVEDAVLFLMMTLSKSAQDDVKSMLAGLNATNSKRAALQANEELMRAQKALLEKAIERHYGHLIKWPP